VTLPIQTSPAILRSHVNEDGLIARLIAGDPAALDRVLALYWTTVVLYAERALHDVDTAKDISQETFIRVWQNRAELKVGALRAFMFRTAHNLIVDELRKRSVRAHFVRTLPLGMTTSDSPADLFDADQTREAVERAMAGLPPRRREAFMLAYMHDLSYREVSQVLGVSPATVKNQVAVALADLRVALAPQRTA
jgi:RNA polymerase sigma factor (sigma-70 family)